MGLTCAYHHLHVRFGPSWPRPPLTTTSRGSPTAPRRRRCARSTGGLGRRQGHQPTVCPSDAGGPVPTYRAWSTKLARGSVQPSMPWCGQGVWRDGNRRRSSSTRAAVATMSARPELEAVVVAVDRSCTTGSASPVWPPCQARRGPHPPRSDSAQPGGAAASTLPATTRGRARCLPVPATRCCASVRGEESAWASVPLSPSDAPHLVVAIVIKYMNRDNRVRFAVDCR